jgi:predicted metal-dependent hydrolase
LNKPTMSDPDRLFQQGVELFNSGAYFEAHEVWEELWTAAEGEDRQFLHALIHFAVGCHHHGRGNRMGAIRQWDKALAKVEPFLPVHRGLRLASVADAARARSGLFPPLEPA